MADRRGGRLRVSLGLLALSLAGCNLPPPPDDPVKLESVLFNPDPTDHVTEFLAGAVNGAEIVVVGDGGMIVRSNDCGESWQDCAVPVHSALTGMSFGPDGMHGWAVSRDALILASSDGGQTWQKQWQGDNQTASFRDVCALDDHRIIAVGEAGLYLQTADGGITWIRRKLIDDDSRLNRISRGPSGAVYVVGERGTLLRSTDKGATWARLNPPHPRTLDGILPIGPRTLLVYGGNSYGRGPIYRTEDDGGTWSAVFVTPGGPTVASVILTHDGAVLLATINNYFVSRDGGRSFSPLILVPGGLGMVRLLEAPNGSILALGTKGATLLKPR